MSLGTNTNSNASWITVFMNVVGNDYMSSLSGSTAAFQNLSNCCSTSQSHVSEGMNASSSWYSNAISNIDSSSSSGAAEINQKTQSMSSQTTFDQTTISADSASTTAATTVVSSMTSQMSTMMTSMQYLISDISLNFG